MSTTNQPISASFKEMVYDQFDLLMGQRGTKLLRYLPNQSITLGEVGRVRQVKLSDAYYKDEFGGKSQFANATYGNRLLFPRAFRCNLNFDQDISYKQGTSDAEVLAMEAVAKCSNKIDEIIIKGVSGPNRTDTGNVELDASNTIRWYDNGGNKGGEFLGNPGDYDPIAIESYRGLNVSKITKASELLDTNDSYGMKICICSDYDYRTLKQDPRAASMLTNYAGPVLSTGQMMPFAGIQDFVTVKGLPTGLSDKRVQGQPDNPANHTVSYAYVVDISRLMIGYHYQVYMEWGKLGEIDNSDALYVKGSYDCTRLEEKAVIRIEVQRDLTVAHA